MKQSKEENIRTQRDTDILTSFLQHKAIISKIEKYPDKTDKLLCLAASLLSSMQDDNNIGIEDLNVLAPTLIAERPMWEIEYNLNKFSDILELFI